MGIDRSTVSNKLRLLKLPEDIQDKVNEGILSERKAVALTPLLELTDEEEEASENLGYWSKPKDIIRSAPGESSDTIRDRVKRCKQQIKDEIERQRKALERQKELEATPAAEKPLRTMDMRHNEYEQIRKKIKGCSIDCACRRRALNYSDKEVDICINPNRLKGLKAKQTRETRKARRAMLDGFRKQIQAKLHPDGAGFGDPVTWSPFVIATLATKVLAPLATKDIEKTISMLPPESAKAFDGLRTHTYGTRDEAVAQLVTAVTDREVGVSMDTLLEFALLALLEREYREFIEFVDRKNIPLFDSILEAEPIPIDVCAQTLDPASWTAVLNWPTAYDGLALPLYKQGWMLFENGGGEYQLKNPKLTLVTQTSAEVGTLMKWAAKQA